MNIREVDNSLSKSQDGCTNPIRQPIVAEQTRWRKNMIQFLQMIGKAVDRETRRI